LLFVPNTIMHHCFL